MTRPSDASLAHTLLRWFVGINIATHGLARLGASGTFANELAKQFATTWLPEGSVRAFALVIPPAELSIGFALLLGFLLRPALAAGMLLLCALTFGTCLRQQWDAAAFQLIYAGAYAALLAGRNGAWLTVDGWVAREKAARLRAAASGEPPAVLIPRP